MTTVACVGIAVQDFIFSAESLPAGPGKNRATERRELGGGLAANAAVAVAALGGEARLVSALGDDSIGETMISDLVDRGVDVSRVRRIEGRLSPLSAVVVDRGGERMLINHTDAGLFLDADLPVGADLDGSDAVLADIRWPDGAEASLVWAGQEGIPGIFDYDVGDEKGLGALTAASHGILSSQALQQLTGENDPAEGLLRLRERVDCWLAVTTGEGGTVWLDGATPRVVPAYQVDVVDTTGAGDVYHGVFALELGSGVDEIAAIETASAAAALSCTRYGGRDGAPSREELQSFMKENR